MKDPIEIFRRYFPRAFVGMRYGDLIRRYATDAELWEQWS